MKEQTIWEDQSQTLTAAATGGRGAVKYRLTNLFLYIEKGILRRSAQQVPIADVGDIDVKASMTQKARGLGDLVIRVHRPNGDGVVTIKAIPRPLDVRRLINDMARPGQAALLRPASTHPYYGRRLAQSVSTAMRAAPAGDPIEQIGKVGVLRDAGIRSDVELTAKRADILSRV